MPAEPNSDHDLPAVRISIPVLLLFETCALFTRSYAQLRMEAAGMARQVATDLSWLLVPLIVLALMWPMLRPNLAALATVLSRSRVSWRLVALSVAFGIVLRLAVWGGLLSKTSFLIFVPADAPAMEAFFSFSCPPAQALLLTTVVSVCLTPFLEELLNRGLILGVLLRHGRFLAVIASAVIFGLYHNPQNIVVATSLGVFLALQYLNSRTLWAPVIAHGTYNLAVVVDWQCLRGTWTPAQVTATSTAVGALSLALLATSLFAAWALLRMMKASKKQGR